jgi:hypothetical protein
MRNLILPSIFAVAVLGACGGGTTTPNPTTDMAAAGDMAGVIVDMTVVPPKVKAPAASCVQGTATSAQVFAIFNGLAAGKCSTSNCHGGPTPPKITSAADVKAMVGLASFSSFKYVEASSPDTSYLLYKLAGQAALVKGGGGGQMPEGAPALSDADYCTVYNWIRSGAAN